jgi:hypothetical protein
MKWPLYFAAAFLAVIGSWTLGTLSRSLMLDRFENRKPSKQSEA